MELSHKKFKEEIYRTHLIFMCSSQPPGNLFPSTLMPTNFNVRSYNRIDKPCSYFFDPI